MIDLEKVIGECKKGKEKSFEVLYNLYASKLLGICIRYAKTNFEAEDILQESFIRIIKSFHSFSGNPESLEAWLKRITLYTAIDQYKNNLKFADQMDINDMAREIPDLSFSELESSLNSEDIVKIVSNLPQGYKLIFNLYAVEGFQHAEIAKLLGISEGTSKSQLAKARKYLRKLLAEQKIMENGIES